MLATRQILPTNNWVARRDPRYRVLIRAKMRAGGMPVEVCIRDVSARGVCIVSNNPPPRGTVVELAGAAIPIVGKVVWANDLRFGIALGGRIDVGRLLTQPSKVPAPHELVPLPRYAREPLPAAQAAERNRNTGHAFQFVMIALAGAIAAVAIGQIVYDTLTHTSREIEAGFRTF